MAYRARSAGKYLNQCRLIVTWQRYQMEAFSALLVLCAGNSPVTGEFPAQRPVRRSFDVSLIYAWINSWVNNREAGDLRRHRANYDVMVMNWTLGNIFRCNSNQKEMLFIPKNTFENVVRKMAAILLWLRCVNWSCHVFTQIFQGCFTGIGEMCTIASVCVLIIVPLVLGNTSTIPAYHVVL